MKIKYTLRFFTLILILMMIVFLTACGGGKDEKGPEDGAEDLSYSHKYTTKIHNDDESDTEFLAEYIGVEGNSEFLNFTIKVSRDGKNIQTINASTILGLENGFTEKFLQFEDLNSDGYKDLVLLYDTYSGSNMSYNIWMWDTKTSAYVESLKGGENIFSNYKVQGENLIVTNIQGGAASGEFRAYTFDDNYEPVLLRELLYSAGETGKLNVSVKDFTAGTFLMFSGEGLKDVPEELVYLGLDGKSVSEKAAEESVYKIAGSKNSGVEVSCEGFELGKLYEDSEKQVFYLMRADKANKTPAYYLVNTETGEVTLKTSSSDLI